MSEKTVRIILVHGACHGAWSWYKVVAGLKTKRYSVTAIDLAASGTDHRRIPEDISKFVDYSKPLMELIAALPDDEKVILVGHSFAGFSLALAMDAYPHKIAAAVFVAAFLPDTIHPPSYIIDQQLEQSPAIFKELEFKNVSVPGSSEQLSITCFGSNALATLLYQNCNFEDLTLANMMMRPISMFLEELSKASAFSKEGFGSIDKIYILCEEDATLSKEFQQWLIQNNDTVKEVIEIKGADHMPMFSKPQELCQCLATIVDKYSEY